MKVLVVGIFSLFFALVGLAESDPWNAKSAMKKFFFTPELVYAASIANVEGTILADNFELTFNHGDNVGNNKTLIEIQGDIKILCQQILKKGEYSAYKEFCY